MFSPGDEQHLVSIPGKQGAKIPSYGPGAHHYNVHNGAPLGACMQNLEVNDERT